MLQTTRMTKQMLLAVVTLEVAYRHFVRQRVCAYLGLDVSPAATLACAPVLGDYARRRRAGDA